MLTRIFNTATPLPWIEKLVLSACITLAIEEEKITNRRICALVGSDNRDVARAISSLQEKGLLDKNAAPIHVEQAYFWRRKRSANWLGDIAYFRLVRRLPGVSMKELVLISFVLSISLKKKTKSMSYSYLANLLGMEDRRNRATKRILASLELKGLLKIKRLKNRFRLAIVEEKFESPKVQKQPPPQIESQPKPQSRPMERCVEMKKDWRAHLTGVWDFNEFAVYVLNWCGLEDPRDFLAMLPTKTLPLLSQAVEETKTAHLNSGKTPNCLALFLKILGSLSHSERRQRALMLTGFNN